MQFRRTVGASQRRGISSRALILTIGFVLMGGFIIFSIGDIFPKVAVPKVMEIHYINKNTLSIDRDTTDYEQFASSLIDKVTITKKEHKEIDIHLILPSYVTAGETADIIFLTKTVESKDVKVILKTQ